MTDDWPAWSFSREEQRNLPPDLDDLDMSVWGINDRTPEEEEADRGEAEMERGWSRLWG